jgi:RHS repeat-associated protein
VGRRRNPTTWTYTSVPQPVLIDRGFTGHEHYDNFGLIDMNGRMYDPVLGRFLGVDPIVQDAGNSQNLNGFGYALNNPLKYIDPSGYSYQRFMEIFAMEQSDNKSSEFFNIYPSGWTEFVSYTSKSHFGNMTYQYNWDRDVYTNKLGKVVSYEEVYYNYILPIAKGENEILLDPNGTTVKIKWTNFPVEEIKWLKRKFQIELELKGGDYERCNWIQTASRDLSDLFLDAQGFYYSNSQIDYYNAWKHVDAYFEDAPNAYFFNSELSLIGLRKGLWGIVNTFSWGYRYDNSLGFYRGYFFLNDNPSGFHQSTVNTILFITNYLLKLSSLWKY